jgi:hypothetical protein
MIDIFLFVSLRIDVTILCFDPVCSWLYYGNEVGRVGRKGRAVDFVVAIWRKGESEFDDTKRIRR